MDRLQAGGSEPPDEVGSIIEHLRVLLNTRKGEAVTVPGFGLVDFSDLVHSFPASVTTLQASIRATILEYEPRLKNVTAGTLRFHTQVSPGGQFRVGTE
jgi:type VI secretion system protein